MLVPHEIMGVKRNKQVTLFDVPSAITKRHLYPVIWATQARKEGKEGEILSNHKEKKGHVK